MWLKVQLRKIYYFEGLSFDTLEELTYILQNDFFQEGQIIFKQDQVMERLYILVSGQVDLYLPPTEKNDFLLDELTTAGSILGHATILT